MDIFSTNMLLVWSKLPGKKKLLAANDFGRLTGRGILNRAPTPLKQIWILNENL